MTHPILQNHYWKIILFITIFSANAKLVSCVINYYLGFKHVITT